MNIPGLQIFQDGNLPIWLVNSVAGIALVCIVHFILSALFNKMIKATSNQSVWRNAFLKGIRRPAMILIWLAVIGWIAKIIQTEITVPLITELTDINRVAFILLITWAITRTIIQAENNLLASSVRETEKKLDPTTIHAVGRLLRVSAAIMAMLIIMQLLGFSISGLLAFGGAGGLIVGYGAKDLLANLFGGLIIFMDKPFGVGDWVRSPDKEIEGTVEYIGWRHTRIRTFDKRPLYVPNAVFSNISVENPSRMHHRRIKETVGIRYQDSTSLESILKDVRTYLRHHDEIAHDQLIMVNFNAFGPSSLDFFVYCFTKTTDWATYQMVKEHILIDILGIVHKHDADVAFPTQTLDLPEQTSFSMMNNSFIPAAEKQPA